jgi:hypothetical protein
MTQWKLVPVEPTEEMIAANGHSDIPEGQVFLAEDARQTWAAMLAAAPAPDVQPVAWLLVGCLYGEELEEWELQAEHGLCEELNHKYVNKQTALPLYTHPPVADVQELERNEQYQMQMTAISTASLGYWKEGDAISPEYDTAALRDVAKLYGRYEAARADVQELVKALREVTDGIEHGFTNRKAGVVIANARATLAKWEGK